MKMYLSGKKITGIVAIVMVLGLVFGSMFGSSMRETVIVTSLVAFATLYLLLCLHRAPQNPLD